MNDDIVFFLLISLLVTYKAKESLATYPTQLLLALSLTGHVLLVAGLFLEYRDVVLTAIAGVVTSIIFLLFYKNSLHKFISIYMILAGVWVIAHKWQLHNLVVIFMLISVALLTTWMWLRESRGLTSVVSSHYRIYRPAQYALATSLLVGAGMVDQFYSVLFIKSATLFSFSMFELIAAGLFLVLAYLIVNILKRLEISWKSRVGLGALVLALVLTLILYQSPSILASIIVLLLGIERGNRVLISFAILSLVYFLGRYYYNLDLSLLHKSFLLMGSGSILLLSGFIAYRQGGHEHV